MNKTLARLLIATALAGFLVASMPTASAQQVAASFVSSSPTVSGSPIIVNSGTAQVSIPWTYSYNAPVQPIGAAVSSATLIWDQPTCPQGITMTGAFSQLINLGQSATTPSQTVTGKSDFTMTASPAAPGEAPLQCTIAGHVEAVSSVAKATTSSTAAIPFSVKYYGLLTANIPTTIAQGGPQSEIRYEIELTNLGNAFTGVSFEVSENVAAGAAGWQPQAPIPIILGPSQQSGGADFTKKVSFLVSTPHKNGWNNDDISFQLTITPASTITPDDRGTPIGVNVLSRVRGIYVPGPEPMLLVAAIVGAALVARLSKTE